MKEPNRVNLLDHALHLLWCLLTSKELFSPLTARFWVLPATLQLETNLTFFGLCDGGDSRLFKQTYGSVMQAKFRAAAERNCLLNVVHEESNTAAQH
eukprot:174659-Pelagomonas_calceolata.AAC.4